MVTVVTAPGGAQRGALTSEPVRRHPVQPQTCSKLVSISAHSLQNTAGFIYNKLRMIAYKIRLY